MKGDQGNPNTQPWGRLMSVLAGMSLATMPLVAQQPCQQPLSFKEVIRAPDEWELRWEADWPDASQPLADWRADNFMQVQRAWRLAAPCHPSWKVSALKHGLPEAAAWLPLWRMDWQAPCGCEFPDSFWETLVGMDGAQALAWLHASLPKASMPLSSWAPRVRSGIRLLENLELPRTHVVQSGETVYQIGRMHNVSPRCIGELNDVWDNLQPGMTLLIPHSP